MRTVLVAVWILALAVPVAAEPPQVTIKAHTELRIRSIRPEYGGQYVVRGVLLDRVSGQGLPDQRIEVRVGQGAATVVTGSDGLFIATLKSRGGAQAVAVDFGGDDHLDAAQLRLPDYDVDKAPVELAVIAEPGEAGVTIAVEARSDDQPLALVLSVFAGAAEAADLPLVGRITSGSGSPLTLPRRQLGGPGAKRATIRFEGDERFAPATVDTTFVLTAGSTTRLQVDDAEVAHEDEIVARGRVLDEDGRGIAGVAVAVLAADERVGDSVTDASGAFTIRFEAEVLGAGRTGLQAAVTTAPSWLRASRSTPVLVTVAAPAPLPLAYTLAAFAATALAAAGFFVARLRPWRHFQRRPPRGPSAAPTAAPAESGIAVPRPSLVATLRRPVDHTVAGVIVDSMRGRTLDGAEVTATLDGASRRTTATGGQFVLELDHGAWKLTVTAPGHLPASVVVEIPHRGELRKLRVGLVAVRERVFELYRRVAEPLLAKPEQWGIWTPRQIVGHVRRQRPSPALVALTDWVEEIYFSPRPPAAQVIVDTEELVMAAAQEQRPAPPPVSAPPGVPTPRRPLI